MAPAHHRLDILTHEPPTTMKRRVRGLGPGGHGRPHQAVRRPRPRYVCPSAPYALPLLSYPLWVWACLARGVHDAAVVRGWLSVSKERRRPNLTHVPCRHQPTPGSVSKRTSFVVAGTVLEDGRPVEEGKKYKVRPCFPILGVGWDWDGGM
jgi:hypothetical protein